LNITMSSLY